MQKKKFPKIFSFLVIGLLICSVCMLAIPLGSSKVIFSQTFEDHDLASEGWTGYWGVETTSAYAYSGYYSLMAHTTDGGAKVVYRNFVNDPPL